MAQAVDWAYANRQLEGAAAVTAVQDKRWDPSVQSLVAFLVNHDRIAYQKDLGAASAATAGAMTRFDPDATWTALPPP